MAAAAFLADPLPGFDPATQALGSLAAEDLQYLVRAIRRTVSFLNVCSRLSIIKGGLAWQRCLTRLTRHPGFRRSRCASHWRTEMESSQPRTWQGGWRGRAKKGSETGQCESSPSSCPDILHFPIDCTTAPLPRLADQLCRVDGGGATWRAKQAINACLYIFRDAVRLPPPAHMSGRHQACPPNARPSPAPGDSDDCSSQHCARRQVAAKVGEDELGGMLADATGLSESSRKVLGRVWRLKSPLLLSSDKASMPPARFPGEGYS